MKWNKKNYKEPINKTFQITSTSIYIVAILYYYFAFHIFNNQLYAEGILQFNSFIAHYFPGVGSRNMISEGKYGNGRYIEYLAGISIIIALLTSIFSIYTLAMKNLWTDYSTENNLMIFILSYIGLGLIFIGGFYSLYFQTTQHSLRIIYSTIGATLFNLSIALIFSLMFISTIDICRFLFFRNKHS
ncbi:hypothetical protein [Sulfuricurvum sp.]|uniref:hypothetical protein n=1 Tax=Sulfuricurvum sp. TaxID=2025608 RepID=UPI00261EB8BB|nr:hypothetical protein [Sulfuricurvum sp.]MDD4950807.1 hypothetical protein [Sulfuricurvum sp.]